MTERDTDIHPRLLEYLDGRLSADEAAEVEAWVDERPERGRLVAEHRRAWDLLGEGFPETEPALSAEFRDRTVARARAERRRFWTAPRWIEAAAVLLVAVSLYAWFSAPDRIEPSPPDEATVAELDLLRNMELIESMGDELDLIADFETYNALQGQLDGAAR